MSPSTPPWSFDLSQAAPESAQTPNGIVRVGDRVRLHPGRARRGNTDIFDLALDGKTAVVAAIEQDYEGRLHVAVTLEDDPGRDLGQAALPAHRFFFSPDELQPLTTPRGETA